MRRRVLVRRVEEGGCNDDDDDDDDYGFVVDLGAYMRVYLAASPTFQRKKKLLREFFY